MVRLSDIILTWTGYIPLWIAGPSVHSCINSYSLLSYKLPSLFKNHDSDTEGEGTDLPYDRVQLINVEGTMKIENNPLTNITVATGTRDGC